MDYNKLMTIQIIAHPGAKQTKVEGDLLGTIHVWVNEPPLDGRANAAIINALAKHFAIPRNKIFLTSGEKSKNKIFEIDLTE